VLLTNHYVRSLANSQPDRQTDGQTDRHTKALITPTLFVRKDLARLGTVPTPPPPSASTIKMFEKSIVVKVY